jgi:iron complex outermembrane receptor protein
MKIDSERSKQLRLAIAAVLATLATSHAIAQEATSDARGEPRTMDKIRVEDAGESDAPYIPRRSSSATKTDTPLLETPQSVTVLTSDLINDQASLNLQEVLRYVPGVRHELYGIDNRGDWFSLRGSDESTVLLDGLKLPLTGYYGVVRVEPFAYERIEVIRGPSSIIAGQNDPGGVVNIVSKRPRADAAGEFGISLGNFDHREVRGDITGPLNTDGSLMYRLVGVGKESDTQIDFADESRTLVAPSLTWLPNERSSITVYGEYQHDRSKNTNAFLGLDGTLRSAPNGPIPRDLFIGEPSWDTYGGERWRFGYQSAFELSSDWQLRHSLRHDDVEGLMKSMYANWWDGFVDVDGDLDPNGEYLGRLTYVYEDSARVTTGDILLEGHIETAGIQHTLLFGVDGLTQDSRQRSLDATSAPLNVYDPVYGVVPDPSFDAATPSTENEVTRVGFLAQDQIKLVDRFSVRAGVRRDKVRNVVVGTSAEEDWATSINIGAVYEAIPGLAPYVSYSESFNPVAGTDSSGRGYKPKKGEQIEAGVKWIPESVPLQATAALYSLKEKNRLASDPLDITSQIQIGEAKIRGAELEAKGDIGSWSVIAGYAYTRARASAASFGGDLDSGEQLEGIPERTASLWAVYDFESLGIGGLRVGGGVRYTGRIGDGTGQVFVPSVTLFDAMASYDVGAWRVGLNANNLTDKSYIATCLSRGDCWFGQGRRVIASVSYLW